MLLRQQGNGSWADELGQLSPSRGEEASRQADVLGPEVPYPEHVILRSAPCRARGSL